MATIEDLDQAAAHHKEMVEGANRPHTTFANVDFIAGAMWDKQRAISKACNFLVDAAKYMKYNVIEDCYSFDSKQLLEDFKEYMEKSV